MSQGTKRPLLELDGATAAPDSLRMECVEAVIGVDDEGRIEVLNQAAQDLFGCSNDHLGQPAEELIEGGLPGLRERAETGPREVIGKRGEARFPLGLTVAELTLSERSLRIGFLWDLSPQKIREADLEHQSTHDVLTGLPNRLLLWRLAESMLSAREEDSGSVAILVIELNRLREVNDTLGHQIGDQMLRSIVERLRVTLRAGDMMARMDGDQFVALLPGVTVEEAQQVAEKLVEAVRPPFEVNGLNLQAEVTIGVSLYPDHAQELASLLQIADVAMARAKRARQPLAFYEPEQDHSNTRQLALTGELQRAVEEDHLILFYQPKIHASTNRIAGVEALVRWNHPYQGLLFPDEFIPLAEHTGLIKPITRWVLDAAFKQCASWEKMGIPLPISVNCSARNLLEEDLPEIIDANLRQFNVAPERFTLEITETTLIEDPARAMDVATALSTQGIRISIDDFGTGYSSLDYLRKLPAKELKIDKSFVMKMDENEGDAVLVRSIIDLAHNLGLKAIAEGVETGAVWNRLQSLGCDSGQGYFFAKPIPVDLLSEWLRTSAWGLPLRLVGQIMGRNAPGGVQ